MRRTHRPLAALFAVSLLATLAVVLTCSLPQAAFGLEVAKCTARPNADTGSDVLGGVDTRITWEGQCADDESLTQLALTLPEGTQYSLDDARVTMLTGEDLMTRVDVTVDAQMDGQTARFTFSEPTQPGGYFRIEIYDVLFPGSGGDMQLAGTYTLADGSVHDIEGIPAIGVVNVSPAEQLSSWLESQDWVQAVEFEQVLAPVPRIRPFIVSSFPVVYQRLPHGDRASSLVAFPLRHPVRPRRSSLMRMATFRAFCAASPSLYVNVVRGTPLFLQIYIAFFGLPLAGVQSARRSRWASSCLAMNSSAYLCEIFRAGIQSIPKGQFEASRSLGMNGAQTMLFVIIPQTVRRVIPTMTSEFILLVQGHLAACGRGRHGGGHVREDHRGIHGIHHTLHRGGLLLPGHHTAARQARGHAGSASLQVATAGLHGGGKRKKRSKKGAPAPALNEADALRRPDAMDGDFITPEQMSSL